MLSAVLEAGFDYKALPVIMLGGGAAIVSRQIQPNRLAGFRPASSQSEHARDLESPAVAFIAERPVINLCRLAALPDDKLNAIGYERILAQMSPRVGQS